MFVIGTLLAAVSLYFANTRLRPRTVKTEGDDNDEVVHQYSDSPNNINYNCTSSTSNNDSSQLPSHIQREIYKLRQRKSKIPLISMKKPMYDNVYMLDQDHELLCTVSMKKARWYINKGIAEWTSFKKGLKGKMENNHSYARYDAKCIRLLFAHSGRSRRTQSNNTSTSQSTTATSTSESLYLCSAKRNICVSCGKSDHHIRHYIVPYAYRSLLPDQYKSHMSHDIVILCPDCHLDCERSTKRRMKDMEYELRMKVTRRKNEDNDKDGRILLPHINTIDPVIDDPKLGQVRSCALALMKWKSTMPKEKVDHYDIVVRTYLASSVCTDEEEQMEILNRKDDVELTKLQLQMAINVKYRTKNPHYIPGADIVIQSLDGNERKIELFIREWRSFFIETVHPRHMPVGWNIDNPVVCGSRENEEE